MKTLLVLALCILTSAWALRWFAIKIGAHPAPRQRQSAANQSARRNPYLDFSFEGDLYPILNHPDTPRRIEECADGLHNAREHLAEKLGRKALAKDGVKSGYNREFLQEWKTVCEVARAKYGDVIFRKGLNLTGCREPSSFDIKYGDLW